MFEWDEANKEHIAKHTVSPKEAEQVLRNDPLELPPPQFRNGEIRFVHLGETNAGRILFVIVTERGERLRVVTAFEADPKDRRYYAVRKGLEHGKQTRASRFRE